MHRKIFILIIAAVSPMLSQTILPSYYFTYGEYSSGILSRSHSAYITTELDYKYYPTIAYDNLFMNNPQWKYRQQTMIAALYISETPGYARIVYGHIQGDYELYPIPSFDVKPFSYSDHSNLFGAEAFAFVDYWYIGASAALFDVNGILTLDSLRHNQSAQAELRIDYYFYPDVYLSFKPAFTQVEDGRKLFSASFKAAYFAFDDITIKVGGSIGRRAYYFDMDTYTIFNQYETQKMTASIQGEYTFWENFSAMAMFLYTRFEGRASIYSGGDDYTVKYFSAGLKARF